MTQFFRQGRCALPLLLLGAAVSFSHAQPFTLSFTQPTMDRWMYPFNASPGCRASAPVFGTLGDAAGVDSRHGQYLLGFDTIAQTVTNCGSVAELSSFLTTNQGPANYLIRRARLTVVINRDKSFRYDPTPDAYTCYFETNHPQYTPDTDPGHPIELFGVGFRNGYGVESFWEDAPFGSSASGGRNAYAAGYSTIGTLVDVSNNVGKTSEAFPRFEVYPFAIGETDTVLPGALGPTETIFQFHFNLEDPLVLEYLREGLNGGRLRFMMASLHTSDLPGSPPAWPDFFTRDSVLGSPATLDIEGTLVSPTDTDGDNLPDDWEQFYFGSLDPTAGGDEDGDGQNNTQELAAGTNPKDNSSALKIVSIGEESGRPVLRFSFAASRQYIIEHSVDLNTWSAIENPALVYYTAPGVAELKDEDSVDKRFYRVRVK